jgi:hypothetical protein
MTTKNGKLYWAAPEGKIPTMIIFSNNGGEKAGGGDLEFVNGATYHVDGSYTMDTTGVETIETATEAPVYFNLQGVRVENPSNGIFIKVSGNKTTKVYVK